MQRNSVSFKVLEIDTISMKLSGTLEVDLVQPLNSASVRIPVRFKDREIHLSVKLREFYVRQLTGRYSIPLKLDMAAYLKTPSPLVDSSRIRASCTEMLPQASDESAIPPILYGDPLKTTTRFRVCRQESLESVWLLGVFPHGVAHQEMTVLRADESLIALRTKIEYKSCRVKRVIFEVFGANEHVIARKDFREVESFTFGRVIEVHLPKSITVDSVKCLQCRLDIRLALDPICKLKLTL